MLGIAELYNALRPLHICASILTYYKPNVKRYFLSELNDREGDFAPIYVLFNAFWRSRVMPILFHGDAQPADRHLWHSTLADSVYLHASVCTFQNNGTRFLKDVLQVLLGVIERKPTLGQLCRSSSGCIVCWARCLLRNNATCTRQGV